MHKLQQIRGRGRRALLLITAVVTAIMPSLPALSGAAFAATDDAPFSLQVTPSPLVVSVKPGEDRTLELRIRNNNTTEEKLKIEARSLKVDSEGSVQLLNDIPADITRWAHFTEPTFAIRGGEWFSEHIQLSVPKDSGFSYSFAIVISRSVQPKPAPGKQAIQGAVAVFTLINVDKPGATRQFTVDRFQSSKRMYEYLPASFSFKLTNTGNTILQPVGNIFIQRTSSGQPISVLPLNPSEGYVLPGSGRTLSIDWSDGFPVYQAQKAADNVAPKNKLVWDWDKAQHFRFGRYVAKMVAVYNNGQSDVPVEAEVSFWVIPWKLLLVGGVVLALLVTGVVVIVRKLIRLGRHKRSDHYEAA